MDTKVILFINLSFLSELVSLPQRRKRIAMTDLAGIPPAAGLDPTLGEVLGHPSNVNKTRMEFSKRELRVR